MSQETSPREWQVSKLSLAIASDIYTYFTVSLLADENLRWLFCMCRGKKGLTPKGNFVVCVSNVNLQLSTK